MPLGELPPLRGFTKGWFSKRVALADVPPERKPERGYIRMFPRNENRNEGYVRMFPRNENLNEGTFAKTTLLSPLDFSSSQWDNAWAFPDGALCDNLTGAISSY